MENEKNILKFINREIVKCAKKGVLYYYWNISQLDKITIDKIITELEKDNKVVKSKGTDYKLIMW